MLAIEFKSLATLSSGNDMYILASLTYENKYKNTTYWLIRGSTSSRRSFDFFKLPQNGYCVLQQTNTGTLARTNQKHIQQTYNLNTYAHMKATSATHQTSISKTRRNGVVDGSLDVWQRMWRPFCGGGSSTA